MNSNTNTKTSEKLSKELLKKRRARCLDYEPIICDINRIAKSLCVDLSDIERIDASSGSKVKGRVRIEEITYSVKFPQKDDLGNSDCIKVIPCLSRGAAKPGETYNEERKLAMRGVVNGFVFNIQLTYDILYNKIKDYYVRLNNDLIGYTIKTRKNDRGSKETVIQTLTAFDQDAELTINEGECNGEVLDFNAVLFMVRSFIQNPFLQYEMIRLRIFRENDGIEDQGSRLKKIGTIYDSYKKAKEERQ